MRYTYILCGAFVALTVAAPAALALLTAAVDVARMLQTVNL